MTYKMILTLTNGDVCEMEYDSLGEVTDAQLDIIEHPKKWTKVPARRRIWTLSTYVNNNAVIMIEVMKI